MAQRSSREFPASSGVTKRGRGPSAAQVLALGRASTYFAQDDKRGRGQRDDRVEEYGRGDAGGDGASEPGGVFWSIDDGRCAIATGAVGGERAFGDAHEKSGGSGAAFVAGNGVGLFT